MIKNLADELSYKASNAIYTKMVDKFSTTIINNVHMGIMWPIEGAHTRLQYKTLEIVLNTK
jgi:hypothetical protein